MEYTVKLDELLFGITKEDVQYEAMEKIGRYLTEEELYITRKGLKWGLLTGIDTVYNTIFKEMLDEK